MNRLVEIEELIQELQTVDPTFLVRYPEWNDVTDDVVRKLRLALSYCRRESETASASLQTALLTPPHSCHSNSSASSTHSDSSIFSDQYYVMASQAFDRQIYSRCVQIVENAQDNGPIDIPLISLGHHSYMQMVNAAEDNEDALKFAQWWNQFLESVEPGRSNKEKNELLEYRLAALERLYELETLPRKQTAVKIIKTAIRSYKSISVNFRSFHSKTLRRLEKLAQWLEEVRDSCEDTFEFKEGEDVLDEAIQATLRDKRKYENETSFQGNRTINRDSDYALCCEILDSLEKRSDSDEDLYGHTPTQKSITSLMEKIFPREESPDSSFSDESLPLSDVPYSHKRSSSNVSEENVVVRL